MSRNAPAGGGVGSERIGLMAATHAAVALADAQQLQHVTPALINRDLIGQAKGILMERHRIDADQAFALPTTQSQQTKRKLVEVARQVTQSVGRYAAF